MGGCCGTTTEPKYMQGTSTKISRPEKKDKELEQLYSKRNYSVRPDN